MQYRSLVNGLTLCARRWRRLVLLAAFGMALAQGALLVHQIHDFDTPHQLTCQLCLYSTGQAAALLAAPPIVPVSAATQELPLLRRTLAILPPARHLAWARAPPA